MFDDLDSTLERLFFVPEVTWFSGRHDPAFCRYYEPYRARREPRPPETLLEKQTFTHLLFRDRYCDLMAKLIHRVE